MEHAILKPNELARYHAVATPSTPRIQERCTRGLDNQAMDLRVMEELKRFDDMEGDGEINHNQRV
jgi:hypothetical protein